ncbi:thioredoxin family protein [Pseudomonas sp. UL073]|uniref:Thioredoxin family protein n=1 Tax=Zestomonas insulae TaxID=2809017 RepID=A0ABS2IHI1_9GAMM|nr:thioredoxin family protein [Pseudomonas insulae]MBM7062531.1 thioredoxin family protein [Pseudomonas insulae]
MSLTSTYAAQEPSRAAVDALPGATLIEFGAPWCGHCQAAQAPLAAALALQPELRHLKIEDGRGRRLGRSFRVTLWPTLILLRDGTELARLVRPRDAASIAALWQQLAAEQPS